MSALIREAIERTYGGDHSNEEDIAAMRRGREVWPGRVLDGEAHVDRMGTGTVRSEGYGRASSDRRHY